MTKRPSTKGCRRLDTADDIWTTLFERGGPALNKPVVLPGVGPVLGVDFSLLGELFKFLSDVDENRRNNHLRVYRGSQLDRHAERRLFSKLPQVVQFPKELGPEVLQAWMTSALEGPPYTLVINRAERWALRTAQCASALNQALFDRHALPSYTSELTIFAGHYQYTPFGIHLDGPSFRVLHVHLGPGPKRFYLWHKDDFDPREHPCDHLEFPPAQLLERAKCFEVRSGDLFLLPAQHYHIASCEPFGMGLAIVYRRETPHTLARDALKRAQVSLCEHIDPKADIFNPEAILPCNGSSQTLAQWSASALERYILLKQSAMGWTEPPALAPRPNADHLRDTKLGRIKPYPLLWRRHQGRIEVFARHRLFSLVDHPAVIALLGELTDRCCFHGAKLIERHRPALQSSTVLHLLSFLVHYRAFETIEDCPRCDGYRGAESETSDVTS